MQIRIIRNCESVVNFINNNGYQSRTTTADLKLFADYPIWDVLQIDYKYVRNKFYFLRIKYLRAVKNLLLIRRLS